MSDNAFRIIKLYDISDVVLIKTCKNRNFQCAFKILAQQLVKSMSRTVPVQNFPWAIVEHRLHPFDLAPRHALELGASGKELPQQAVRVLVRPPLPGTLGMGKVDLHLGLFGEQPMLPHLLSLVVREGAAELSGQCVRTSRAKARRTAVASLAVRGTSSVNRVVRSTNVPSADAFAWPTSKSPSQWPGTVRSATSGGRSSMLTMS